MAALARIQSVLDQSGDPDNPGPEAIRAILESVHSIAVVGISRNPEKAARRVPTYLAAQGYDIVPVNPRIDRIFGKAAYASLEDVREPVDMVLVFRPSEEAAEIAKVALGREEKPVVWLQEEIRADAVAARAREEGATFVQDLCAYKIHRAMTGEEE